MGTCVPGITHCVKRSFWSGSRTRDSRNLNPMLYPSELSSGRRAGLEPATCVHAAALSSELTSLPKHRLALCGIRHGRAARTGRDQNPCRCRTFARCFALASVARRQSVWAHAPNALRSPTAPPAPKHPGTTPCGASTASPLRRASARMLRGRLEIADFQGKTGPLRAPETKRPRVVNPRAFAFLGRSGSPTSRIGKVSVECAAALRRDRRRSSARTHPRRGAEAATAAIWRCR